MNSSSSKNLQNPSLIETLLFLIDFISDPVNTIPEINESFRMYSNFAFLFII